jgi:hypothetical protein
MVGSLTIDLNACDPSTLVTDRHDRFSLVLLGALHLMCRSLQVRGATEEEICPVRTLSVQDINE